MAYSQKIRDRACDAWCISGNMEEAVRQVKDAFPGATGIDRKTLGRWRQEDDWDSRRAGIRQRYREAKDRKLADSMGEIEGKLERLIGEMFNSLFDLTPERFGEAAAILPAILNQYRRFTGVDGGGGELTAQQFRGVFSRLLKAMGRVPAIKEVLTEEVRGQLTAEVEREFAQA